MVAKRKEQTNRHPLKIALLVALFVIAVPSVALTVLALGMTVGVLFGWMSRGLGKT